MVLRTGLLDWGLPACVGEAYAARGLKRLYPWQAAALELGINGSNLIYCAPTSGTAACVNITAATLYATGHAVNDLS